MRQNIPIWCQLLKGLKTTVQKKFIEPSVANAKNKTYPVVRPLYFYYEAKSEKTVKPFVDYVLSAKGQKIVSDVGFIPVK